MEYNQQHLSQAQAVVDNLKTRRSIRKFKPEVPDLEVLQTIIECGQYAPTGHNRQNNIFVLVEKPELLQKLSSLNAEVLAENSPHYQEDPFYGAPALIAVLSSEKGGNAVKNGSAAIENILLAAHALGLGACWINRAKEVFEMEEGKAILRSLDIDEDAEGIGFVVLGIPDQKPAPASKRVSRVVMAL